MEINTKSNTLFKVNYMYLYGSFETKYSDETLKGDLYKSNQYNNYYFDFQ